MAKFKVGDVLLTRAEILVEITEVNQSIYRYKYLDKNNISPTIADIFYVDTNWTNPTLEQFNLELKELLNA